MIPLDDVLEALDAPRAEPGPGYLERLFAAFNDRVPFENGSKIVRDREVADPADKPRRPEIFWNDHLERGAGGTCFARVAAFEALLSGLGFSSRLLLGAVSVEGDHAALLVDLTGKDWICDVGFPLPALLACAEGETETGLGEVRLSRTPRGWRADLGGVPEGPRSLELYEAAVSREEYARRWKRTFRPGSHFLAEVKLRRQTADRVVSFVAGELRVDDRHSRLRIPLPAPRLPVLEREFRLDADLLRRAFAVAGDPDSSLPEPELSVYAESKATAQAAFDAIASPEGYGRLMEGAARVVASEPSERGWRATLAPPETASASDSGAASFREEITPDSAALSLRVDRSGRASSYEPVIRSGRVYLVRRAPLPFSPEELLRNPGLRGRLAGTLAADLLAWERLL